MNPNNVWKKNREFYIGVAGTVLEGLFSGSLFMLLYSVMRFLWDGQFDMNRVLVLTGVIAFIFLLRILIYSYGYTKAQIGGAKVSKISACLWATISSVSRFPGLHKGRQAIISTPLPVM